MARAIVTGATGFVGSHLVDVLQDRGWDVAVAVRRRSSFERLEGRSLVRIEVDFTRPFRLPPCDVVFHVAGVVRADRWEEYLEGNRDVAVRVHEASRASRFVHVSSLAAAGPGLDVDEDTPCAPVSLYGRSKLAGEEAVWALRSRIPVTVIRPPVVYGPRDLGLLDLYRVLAWGLRPEIGGEKRLNLVYARDLAEGLVDAAVSAAAADQVFYLAHPETRTMSEVLRAAGEALEGASVALPVPDGLLRLLGALTESAARALGRPVMFSRDKALEMTQPAWCCSPAKAARTFGWRARTGLEEGMRSTMAWYREAGLIGTLT